MHLAGDLLWSGSEFHYGVCHTINLLIWIIFSSRSPGADQALVLLQTSTTRWSWGAGRGGEGMPHHLGPGQRGAAPAELRGSRNPLTPGSWSVAGGPVGALTGGHGFGDFGDNFNLSQRFWACITPCSSP